MDELEELRKANPVAADDVDELVAVERGPLIDALGVDGRPRLSGLRSVSGSALRRRATAGLLVAAAVVAFLVLTIGEPFTAPEVTDTTIASPVSVDAEVVVNGSGDAKFDRNVDLLAVHLDYWQRADGHAAVAAQEIATWFDLEPLVVAGTQAPGSTNPVHDFEQMMISAWTDKWLDATLDRPVALQTSLERWLGVVDAGGRVWVAEGGVSDFTAEILREISRQRPDVDTASLIYVIQHSERNEVDTRPGDLALVKASAAYDRIDPGDAANDTADLTRSSEDFEAAVLAGCHSDRWADAFAYLSAADLDFSDMVALLHILGVGTNQVADADDFVAFFIGDQPDAKARGSS